MRWSISLAVVLGEWGLHVLDLAHPGAAVMTLAPTLAVFLAFRQGLWAAAWAVVPAALVAILKVWGSPDAVMAGVRILVDLAACTIPALLFVLFRDRMGDPRNILQVQQSSVVFLVPTVVSALALALAAGLTVLLTEGPGAAAWRVLGTFLTQAMSFLVLLPLLHTLRTGLQTKSWRKFWSLAFVPLIPLSVWLAPSAAHLFLMPMPAIALMLWTGGLLGASLCALVFNFTVVLVPSQVGILISGLSLHDKGLMVLCFTVPVILVGIFIEQNRTYRSRLEILVNDKTAQLESTLAAMEELAGTDSLTGLSNRRRLLEIVSMEEARTQRTRQLNSLILLDLDKFKNCNDRFGHQTGDLILGRTARIIQESVRKTDACARWGGEEFLILLPGTSVLDACTLAQKLRVRMEEIGEAGLPPMTASFGCAAWVAGESFDMALDRADRAMYKAKHGGRNMVVNEEEAVTGHDSYHAICLQSAPPSGDSVLDHEHAQILSMARDLPRLNQENSAQALQATLQHFEFMLANHYQHEAEHSRGQHPQWALREETRRESMERLRSAIARHHLGQLIFRELYGIIQLELRLDMVQLGRS